MIKKLFVSSVENRGIDGILCPLCSSPMARTMVTWCEEKEAPVNAANPTAAIHATGNSRTTNDLDQQKNPLTGFLKRFSKTYGELGGVSDTYLRPSNVRTASQGGSRPSSRSFGGADDMAFGNEAIKSGAFAPDSPGARDKGNDYSPSGSPTKEMNEANNAPPGSPTSAPVLLAPSTGPTFIDPDKVLPGKFTYQTVLEIACDAVCLQWQSMLKNGNECMGTMLLKVCTRKKMSTRTNDYRIKSVLDFFHAGGPALDQQPLLVLFGKVCGALPRSRNTGYPEMVRKAWGPIATSVLVLAHCERCWKMGQLRDADDNPPTAEVRLRLNKLSNNKTMSLKRAIKLIQILMDSDQPHWMMAPFMAAIDEYGTRAPWSAESISRLLHYIFQCSKHQSQEPTQPTTGHSYRTASSAAGPPTTPKGQTSTDVLRDYKVRARRLWSATSRPTNRPKKSKRREPKITVNTNINVTNNPASSSNAGSPTGRRSPSPTAALGSAGNSRAGSPIPPTHMLDDFEDNMTEDNGDEEYKNLEMQEDEAYTSFHGLQEVPHESIGLLENNSLDAPHSIASMSAISVASATTTSTVGIGGGYPKSDPFIPMHSVIKATAQLNYYAPPRMGVIEDGEFDECTYATATAAADNRHISVADLAIACVEAWENECQQMQFTLNRAAVGNERRVAIVGTFDMETAKSNLKERKAILRILKWYASVFRREVDWAEVRSLSLARKFPFEVPLSLLDKSTAELHNIAVLVASEWEFAQARDFAEDMAARAGMSVEDYAARIVNALHIPRMKNTTGGRQTFHSIHASSSESNHKMYLGEDYQDSADVSLSSEQNDVLHKVNTLRTEARDKPLTEAEAEAWRKYRSPVLAPQTYASDQPVRHPLNMVDVLDNDPILLAKLRLLSNAPVGPHSSKALMRTLDDEIASVMMRMGKADLDESSVESSTHSMFSNQIADEPQESEMDEESSYRRTRDNLNDESNDVLKKEEEELAALEKSKAGIAKRVNNVAVKAKGRVRSAIEMHQKRQRAKDLAKRTSRIEEYEERKREIEEEKLNQIKLDDYDLTYIDAQVANAPVSLQSALAFEKAVKSLEYRDKQVAPGVIAFIANGYLRPWQLEVLVNLDLNNANILAEGGSIIAGCLSKCCRLTHLNLNGNNIGDTSCGKILQGIESGGGGPHLGFIDLRRNQLTMVTDGLSRLGRLTSLTSVNLAWNCITLDNARHSAIFVAAFAPLQKVHYFNVAHNRIQDQGVKVLHEQIVPKMLALTYLDLSHSFITPASFSVLEALMRRPDTLLKTIRLHGNIMTDHQANELRYVAHMKDLHVTLDKVRVPYDHYDSANNTLVK